MSGDEVKSMRRIPFPSAALAAGLAAFLAGCAGETPTSPASGGGGGGNNGGNCNVAIAMATTALNPYAGTEVVVRAAVTKSGSAVPDGTSVFLTTDLGFFAENGLQSVSKTTVAGNADVTLYSGTPGLAHVRASYDCQSTTINITYQGTPNQGPYVSSISPVYGSCAGGDTVTLTGGNFGTTAGGVTFGGALASVVSWASNQIVVKSPIHALKNSSVPEPVAVIVSATTGTSSPVTFTYYCILPENQMSISSMTPTAGSPSGGDTVSILGVHFGVNLATTRVTFCGLAAQMITQADNQIVVSTPAHTLANPANSESCPVVVTRDLGQPSVQSATAPAPFVYKGSGGTGACNTDPTFFVTSLTPNTGSPNGGDIVTITGSGFPSSAALLRVDFGGNPGAIVGTPSSTTLQVSTPRRVLASADIAETVDVVVTDLGSATQRCYRVPAGFVYTTLALTPSFYSVSPRTGPNDQSVRVTAFGANFQFPEQVFFTGGNCGAQRVEVAAPIEVSPSQIVFNTPVAIGGNSCLAGQLVDVVVLNPVTGKTASCAGCFKYYACPSAGVASPTFASAVTGTTVQITGNNFAEPVIANYRWGGGFAPLTVTQTAATSIIVTMPPFQQLSGGSLGCANVDGTIELSFPLLACAGSPLAVPFSYRSDPVSLTAASPTSLNQDGTPGGGPTGGTHATITVTGMNFLAPMTVTLIRDGSPIPNTPVNNANVASPTSLTFTAPSVTNSSFNQQNCGTPVPNGVQFVPTSFGIRVRNTVTGCTADLPNVLVYIPADQTCRAPLTISPSTLPNGKVATAYSQAMTAAGGAGAPYTFLITGGTLPPGLLLSTAGLLSGTPTAAGTSVFTIQVTDASANTYSANYSMVVDP